MIGENSSFLKGRSILLEVNPSSPYERIVSSFADELSKNGCVVSIITNKSSPVYRHLSNNPSLRFLVSTPDISYSKKSDRDNEILLPQNDFAIMLDTVSKAIGSSKGNCVAFIFDSLSDFLESGSFDSTYKFLKSANEVLDGTNVASLFLMTRGIHDSKIVATIRSIFPNHLVSESEDSVKLVRRG